MISASAHYAIQKYKNQLTVAFFQAEYAESTDSFVLRSDVIKRLSSVATSAVLEEVVHAVEGEEDCPNKEEGEDDHDDEEFDEEQNNNIGESYNFENDEQENDEGGRCKIFSLCMEDSLVYREAFRCAWLPIIAQFVNFFITLSLFPGVVRSNP